MYVSKQKFARQFLLLFYSINTPQSESYFTYQIILCRVTAIVDLLIDTVHIAFKPSYKSWELILCSMQIN